jgi:hypothetical protein
MYKPNFCAECGERITRARWHVWTSRRFCHDCERGFRVTRLLLPVLAGAALFSLGLGAGRAVRQGPPPLIVERGQIPATPAPVAQNKIPQANTKPENSPASTRPETPAVGAATERTNDSSETVSLCGALTKKGTPCQRRVRGTGRCWQHQGQPAAIPLEQRLINER